MGSCAFLGFGVYNGIMQWFVYVSLFSRIFPGAIPFANMSWRKKLHNRDGALQLVGQCVLDLAVYVPIIYFPVFYLFRGFFYGESREDSLSRYWANVKVDNVANWAFWLPGDILCFGAPAWARLPISHVEGFVWNNILSWLRGGVQDSS